MSLLGDKYNVVKEWLLASLFYIISNPYFFWDTSSILLLAEICLIFFVITNFRKKVTISQFCGTFILSFFYILVAIRHEGTLLGMCFILILPCFFFLDEELFLKAYNKFILILSITISISIVSYILIVFLDISLPSKEIPPLNPRKDFTYLRYPFLIMENRDIGLKITRFYGIYDEPGVLGSMLGIILCKEHFDIKHKKELIPLLLGGLLTMSLFFYVISVIYFLLFTKFKTKILIILCGALLLPSLMMVDDLKVLLFNRFIIQDGEWLGNSREIAGFSMWYEKFRLSSDYFWGMGSGYNLVVNSGGASYKDIIVNYGLFMFILYILGYAILATRHNIKENVLSIILIFSFIFQRPFITDLSVMYLFLFACLYSPYNQTTKIYRRYAK